MTRVWGIVCAAALLTSAAATAAEYCQPGSPADVGRNWYVPGVPCGPAMAGAQLYVSPRPVPPFVGHTYITHEALMPHQMLYHHHRTYCRPWGPYGGVTSSRVWWH